MNAAEFLKNNMVEGSVWEKRNYFPNSSKKTMKCIYVRDSKILENNGFTLVPENYQGKDHKTNFQKFPSTHASVIDDCTVAFTLYDKSRKTEIVMYTLTLKA